MCCQSSSKWEESVFSVTDITWALQEWSDVLWLYNYTIPLISPLGELYSITIRTWIQPRLWREESLRRLLSLQTSLNHMSIGSAGTELLKIHNRHLSSKPQISSGWFLGSAWPIGWKGPAVDLFSSQNRSLGVTLKWGRLKCALGIPAHYFTSPNHCQPFPLTPSSLISWSWTPHQSPPLCILKSQVLTR